MIRAGFLTTKERAELINLARDGLVEHRLARRANALVLLDRGMSCADIGAVLFLDDDTVRTWFRRYSEEGTEGLSGFSYEGSDGHLNARQRDQLKSWIAETLPRTTRHVGVWIEQEFGIVYQSRSGLVTLLHRLGMEHRKPQAVSQKLDVVKQKAFIEAYDTLMNRLPADEAVMFVDAVHPTHAVRPVGCWAPRETKVAVDQTSERKRMNIHGAIDLETGQTCIREVLTVDAMSTIALLMSIEALYPAMRLIHVFLDNARYHHARLVRDWLAQPGRRIELHFVPAYCPHLNPIERLWGLMHRNITHNRCYATFNEFGAAVLGFLKEDVPRNWGNLCDDVSDNFRVISPKGFRVLM
jgi:transposase